MIRHLGPHTDVEGLVADAREEGREVHVVHAGPTKEATLAAFADTLDFPAWFGGNLDALADCLRPPRAHRGRRLGARRRRGGRARPGRPVRVRRARAACSARWPCRTPASTSRS